MSLDSYTAFERELHRVPIPGALQAVGQEGSPGKDEGQVHSPRPSPVLGKSPLLLTASPLPPPRNLSFWNLVLEGNEECAE